MLQGRTVFIYFIKCQCSYSCSACFSHLTERKALEGKRFQELRAAVPSSSFKYSKGAFFSSTCLIHHILSLGLYLTAQSPFFLLLLHGSRWLGRQPQRSRRTHSQDHIAGLVSLPLRAEACHKADPSHTAEEAPGQKSLLANTWEKPGGN